VPCAVPPPLPCGKAVGAGGAVGFLKFALFG